MSRSTWVETLITAQGDGPAYNTSTTPTSILPAQAKLTLPAQFFHAPGDKVRIKGFARLSNIVTTPGTLTVDVRMGPTANIAVYTSAAMQMSTTAHTNASLEFEINLTCRSVGNGTVATLEGLGKFTSQALSLTAVADSTTTMATLLAPATAPAVGAGFDSTAAMLVDLFATFSVNNAANSLTLHDYSFESLN